MSYAGSKLKPVTVDGSVDRVTGAANVEFMNERVQFEMGFGVQTCEAAVLERILPGTTKHLALALSRYMRTAAPTRTQPETPPRGCKQVYE